MENFKYACRYLFKSRSGNITRIVSLTLGLTVGIFVFSYVNFQLTFDRNYPDYERIYQIWCNYDVDGYHSESTRMAGAMAAGLKDEFPQIEASTRTGWKIVDRNIWYNEQSYPGKGYEVDSNFFKVLDFGTVLGNPAEIFSNPAYVMISESFARKLFSGEDPIGKVLQQKGSNDRIVAGIFKDPPANTHLGEFDILYPLIFEREQDAGWHSGDRYPTYIKLHSGTSIVQIEAGLSDFLLEHNVIDKKNDWNKRYYFLPVTDSFTNGNNTKQIALLLTALGLLSLLVASLNYVLISISAMLVRSKTVAMLKCNGAKKQDIFHLFCWETGIILFFSLISAVLIIICGKSIIHEYSGYTINEIFALEKIWVPATVILGMFLATALIPARIFSAVPLTLAFKGKADNKKGWKRILLALQITSISFVSGFLFVTSLQFHKTLYGDFGYEPATLVAVTPYASNRQLEMFEEELMKLPCVESAGSGWSVPLNGYIGQPCYDEVSRGLLFSARMDICNYRYIPTMGMTIVEGRNFTENSAANEAIVNQAYVNRRNWSGSPIGHIIIDENIPDPTQYTIVGVVQDFKMGTPGEVLPLVIHPLNRMVDNDSIPYNANKTLIRLTKMNRENIETIEQKIKNSPYLNNPNITIYTERLHEKLTPYRHFRNMVGLVSLITILITLMGLIGYLNDEIKRRSKEVAIRKINGASMKDIIILLAREMAYITLPAVIAGVTLSYYVADRWLTQFPIKITLALWIFIVAALVVTCIVYITELFKIYTISRNNPAQMIQNE